MYKTSLKERWSDKNTGKIVVNMYVGVNIQHQWLYDNIVPAGIERGKSRATCDVYLSWVKLEMFGKSAISL